MRAAPYFPFWQRDFVHSCRTERMAPDEIGALVMVMCQQWETMGPISSDPARFSAYTGWDIRVARRLLSRLAEINKIDRSDAGFYSSRMAEEITKYCAKVKSAEDREARKRADALRETSPGLLTEVLEKSDGSSDKLSKKHNYINGHATTVVALPDSDSDSERKKDTPLPPKGGGVRRFRDIARQAFNEWSELATRYRLPVPRETSFTDARAKAILARMTEHAGANPTPDAMIEIWRLGLRNIERSKFLRGMTEHGFRADLTFMCQAKSFTRLIEGGYGNGAHAMTSDGSPEVDSENSRQLAMAREMAERGRLEDGLD